MLTIPVIKFSACRQACVGGDGSPWKLQAYFGVKVELERGLFAVTNRVPPTRLCNHKQKPIFMGLK
jgi:hypothetical protein